MKDFLSKFMSRYKDGSHNAEFKSLFDRTTQVVSDLLGAKPFHVKAGLNAAVYDAVFVSFARHLSDAQRVTKESYARLVGDKRLEELTRSGTTDVETLKERIVTAERYLFS